MNIQNIAINGIFEGDRLGTAISQLPLCEIMHVLNTDIFNRRDFAPVQLALGVQRPAASVIEPDMRFINLFCHLHQSLYFAFPVAGDFVRFQAIPLADRI
ncbi:hypothetical protein SRABI106_02714 [Rahnella aquatilis]|nr:hypothetical protein SRABI106_02714 [Rahnella aquatilis]